MTLAITGANGYIGARLVRLAMMQGQAVVALTRQAPQTVGVAWLPYDLHTGAPELPASVTTLIHLAATVHTADVNVTAEVQAATRLIEATARNGARLIFVSSQTAREDAPTGYGRAKWQIEQHVLAAGGVVLRPGLVYGGQERGLFGRLAAFVRALPVIPGFVPAPRVQPVHVDDLAHAILAIHARPALSARVLCIGMPVPVSFTRFLRYLATGWLRCRRPVIPVPTPLIAVGSRLLGARLSARLGLDRLASLFDLPLMTTADDLALLGIQLRPLEAGMSRSGDVQTRALLREAHTLLTYTLREPPTPALLRRYLLCIRQLHSNQALALPRWVHSCPALLALLDARAQQRDEFAWRINAAVVIGEASPQGARRYLRTGQPAGFLRDGLRIGLALSAELAWRCLRVCVAGLLRPRLQRAGLWK